MNWINFLHFYQPPSADRYTIREMIKYSYAFISKTLRHDPRIKITANINASLLEHLEQLNHHDLIKEYQFLVKDKRIELVMSAAYHPIFSFIPYKESVKQINQSKEILKKYFPSAEIKGFFFPEMIYNKKISKYLKKIGIEWIILDELAFNGKLGQINYNNRYFDQNGLQIIFRRRKYSSNFPPTIVNRLTNKKNHPDFIVSATDAELYGARHFDYNGEFFGANQHDNVSSITTSKYLEMIKDGKKINVRPKVVSWDTKISQFKNNESLHIWKNPKNKIHKKLWELTDFAINVVEKNKDDKNYKWARWRLNRGFSSCTYWFASEKNLGSWDGIQWDPDRITKGSLDLVRSIRALGTIPKRKKMKAEKLYLKIIKLVWERHWDKYYIQKK